MCGISQSWSATKSSGKNVKIDYDVIVMDIGM